MTRFELITSDEFITVSIECSVTSRRKITEIRKELIGIFIKYRDELLHGDQGTGCANKKCKVCYPYGYRKFPTGQQHIKNG